MKTKTTKWMPIVWMILFAIGFLIVFGRVLYIQVTGEVQGVSLTELAEEKRTNYYTIPAKRGTIFDRNGMPLAEDKIVYRLYAVLDEGQTINPEKPRHIVDIDEAADKIAPIIGMEPSEMKRRMVEGKEEERFQVEFSNYGKELTQTQKEEIEALEIPGIYFEEEPVRFYPNGTFASRTIGLAQKNDEGKIVGINGMENYMDEYLTGQDGSISYQRDKYNFKLLNPNEVLNQADDGEQVYLTIDQKVQTLLEDSLSVIEEEYEPTKMSAVVMHAKTGEVLAMSNRPSYDPNNFGDVENWFNDVISNPVEQGSTFKIFTLAAAVNEGVWRGDEYFKSGSYKAGPKIKPISDHNGGRGWGSITYLEGFQRSSNVAVAKLAYEKLGSDKFLEYLQAFDLDKETGIDLPGEVPGRILFDNPIEQITTSFGQGTITTPIQIVKGSSAIANGGEMVKPYLIKKIVDSETGEVIEEKSREVVGQPITKESADQVLDIMESVITSEAGTGKVFGLNDYTVAGKTATAQIPNPETRGYKTGWGNYIYSFIGMAPAEDPQLIMYISVQQPDLDEETYEPGNVTTSFIFKNVMENSLKYLNIEPDKEEVKVENLKTVPDWKDKSTNNVVEAFKEMNINPIVIGDGERVVDVNVKPGEKITTAQKVLIVTNEPTMPNIIGWSLKDLLTLKDLIELDIEWIGSGFIHKQSIEPGTSIQSGSYLMAELQEPTNDTKKVNKDELEEQTE
ncbi:penicillin-binding protein 2B [Gracilibacillus halotolerans]|uniref:serine-type D-Ala-D-Ala carboxypeptidase n=1 Tax=Gracilibacillus halotolerans TaxID=74386 RepID=A0A841RBS2_9BACI|nr:penicillin-binding protein [Gracilibacillus halotolerans]MBB6511350.1 penicillin-binding protein 2B [Gracilibacillus halotolerans]